MVWLDLKNLSGFHDSIKMFGFFIHEPLTILYTDNDIFIIYVLFIFIFIIYILILFYYYYI